MFSKCEGMTFMLAAGLQPQTGQVGLAACSSSDGDSAAVTWIVETGSRLCLLSVAGVAGDCMILL
jgi:hypothetical protein